MYIHPHWNICLHLFAWLLSLFRCDFKLTTRIGSCYLHHQIPLSGSMLLLSICHLKQSATESSFFCCSVCHCALHITRMQKFSSCQNALLWPQRAVRLSPRAQGIETAQGNGGTGERNFEWAIDQLPKCLNAYSELPTTHVNQCSYRPPLFPLSPSYVSLYLSSFLIVPASWIRSRTSISGGRKPIRRSLRGSRSLAPRLVWGKCSVCLSVHTYVACTVPAVCLLHQWGRCCWGSLSLVVSPALPGCTALFFPAVADARPLSPGHAHPALGLLLQCRWWGLTQHWRKLGLSQRDIIGQDGLKSKPFLIWGCYMFILIMCWMPLLKRPHMNKICSFPQLSNVL